MAITRLFGSIMPATGINHTTEQTWNIFSAYSRLIVTGDQLELPGGINAFLRFTIEGNGRLDGLVRLRGYDDDKPILDTPFVIDPPPGTSENTVTCCDMCLNLPVYKLYPKIAASSLGADMKTTFLLEILVPRILVDPSHQDESPERSEAAVLAASPIFLICRVPTPQAPG